MVTGILGGGHIQAIGGLTCRFTIRLGYPPTYMITCFFYKQLGISIWIPNYQMPRSSAKTYQWRYLKVKPTTWVGKPTKNQAFKHSNPFNLPSLKRTAKGPENGWLEDDSFPFGAFQAYFQGLCLAVSFREGMGFIIWVFPKKSGTPKSWILIGLFPWNFHHPFCFFSPPIFGNTHMDFHGCPSILGRFFFVKNSHDLGWGFQPTMRGSLCLHESSGTNRT